MSAQLSISSLSKSFDKSGLVLDDVNFEIELGSRLAIIGPSGCGKSTLIRVLAGFEQAQKPFLHCDGQAGTQLSHFGKVSYVFQESNLLPWRNVFDNVALPLELENIPIDEQHINTQLKRVGLLEHRHQHPNTLSGGMKMRAALARALIIQPDFMLLDEPFGALDEFTRENMGQEFTQLWQQTRPTAILITHDIEEALFLCDHILVLSQKPGRVLKFQTLPFPQNRSLELKHEKPFLDLKRELSSIIRSQHS